MTDQNMRTQSGAKLKVLVIWPPHVPSYFNAGHHLGLFEVGAYLRGLAVVGEVRCVDAGALNYSWKDVGDLLFESFDLIAVMNEFDALEGIGRLVRYARELTPRARLITFGRLSSTVPRFFERYDLDAVVHSGDYESGVAAYVHWLSRGGDAPPGVAVRAASGWCQPTARGVFLEPSAWVLPDISEIPYDAYSRMYASDQNKFCGIPDRKELVLPVARGCPVGCEYCDVPLREGLKERRLPVKTALEYIEASFAKGRFEYVAMYAPTFTLNRPWVEEFCRELIARGSRYPFKCTTTVHHLNEPLIALMARAGCVRISVGLETLDPAPRDTLPSLKRTAEERFTEVSGFCTTHGIELNCFVILGMPGSSVEGSRHTVDRVRESGGRVRPTIYTPFHDLTPDMDEATVQAYNRQLFLDSMPAEEAAQLYPLYFGKEPRLTRVMDRVPTRLPPDDVEAGTS